MGSAEQKKRLISAYARAYTYAYGTLWTKTTYEHIVALYQFLTQVRSAGMPHALGFYFGFTCISNTAKKEQLLRLLHEYELTELFVDFCTAVLDSGHGALLLPMMRIIIEWYENREHIVHAEISTATTVSLAQRQELAVWVQQLMPDVDVRIVYRVCPALLAGVRLETKNSVAEYSVRRQLYTLSQLCKHEDITWQ